MKLVSKRKSQIQKKIFFAALLWILSPILGFQWAQASEFESLLSRDLKAAVKSIKREVRIYHYFSVPEGRNDLVTVEGRQKAINQYLEMTAGNFWNLSYHSLSYSNAGPGIYLGIDPQISSSFGNSAVEMTLPTGTLYVSVVKPVPIKSDTLEALAAEGILTASEINEVFVGTRSKAFYRDTLKKMVVPKYEAFRVAVQNVFEKLGISFIEYNWNSSLEGFCRTHNYSAFVYVGQRNFEEPHKARVEEHFRDLPIISSFQFPQLTTSEEDAIERVTRLRSVLRELTRLRNQGEKIPKDFVLRHYSAQELKQVKSQIFSCE